MEVDGCVFVEGVGREVLAGEFDFLVVVAEFLELVEMARDLVSRMKNGSGNGKKNSLITAF